jgi:phosphonate metabolism protein PhnN/1,5-bisphosphokinase (PRPP-forming)
VLVLVVGPSGAGKDTLIAGARAAFGDDPGVVFPRRIITRQDVSGEDHTPISEAEFARRLAAGDYCLWWDAHGLRYGIDRNVVDMLTAGRMVIVNVSRSAIAAARGLWSPTRVVHVVVDAAVLRQRLAARGRERGEEIERRVARAEAVAVAADEIDVLDNSAAIEDGIARFVALLRSYRQAALAG